MLSLINAAYILLLEQYILVSWKYGTFNIEKFKYMNISHKVPTKSTKIIFIRSTLIHRTKHRSARTIMVMVHSMGSSPSERNGIYLFWIFPDRRYF